MLTLTHYAGFNVEPDYRLQRAPDLDGAADYLYAPFGPDTVDSYDGSCAFWARRDTSGNQVVFSAGNGGNGGEPHTVIEFDGLDRLRFFVQFGGTYVRFLSTPTFGASSAWRHFGLRWSFASAGSKVFDAFAAGAPIAGTVSDTTGAAVQVPWSSYGSMAVGAFRNASLFFNGPLQDFWLHTREQFADIGAFRDPVTGKPAPFGVDGDEPTGTAPPIYLHDDYDLWGRNFGTRGDLIVQSGPWAAADSSPSD